MLGIRLPEAAKYITACMHAMMCGGHACAVATAVAAAGLCKGGGRRAEPGPRGRRRQRSTLIHRSNGVTCARAAMRLVKYTSKRYMQHFWVEQATLGRGLCLARHGVWLCCTKSAKTPLTRKAMRQG
jgi:hypothetical protein